LLFRILCTIPPNNAGIDHVQRHLFITAPVQRNGCNESLRHLPPLCRPVQSALQKPLRRLDRLIVEVARPHQINP